MRHHLRQFARVAAMAFVLVAGAVSASAAVSAPGAGVPAAENVSGAVPATAADADDPSVLAGTVIVPQFRLRDILEFASVRAFLEAAAAPPPPPPAPVEVPAPPPPDTVTEKPAPAPPRAPAPPPPPPAPPSPPAPRPAPRGLDTSPMNGYEQALFNATNQRRISSGLRPLAVNSSLVGIARIRSQDMSANHYFAHTSPTTGDTAFTLMDKYGVGYSYAGENLAENNYPGDQCAGAADTALWNSAPHRENILNPNFTQMGVALATDGAGMHYFTILFIG